MVCLLANLYAHLLQIYNVSILQIYMHLICILLLDTQTLLANFIQCIFTTNLYANLLQIHMQIYLYVGKVICILRWGIQHVDFGRLVFDTREFIWLMFIDTWRDLRAPASISENLHSNINVIHFSRKLKHVTIVTNFNVFLTDL